MKFINWKQQKVDIENCPSTSQYLSTTALLRLRTFSLEWLNNGSFKCLVTVCVRHSPDVWGPRPEHKSSNSRYRLIRSSYALPATLVVFSGEEFLKICSDFHWKSCNFKIGKKFKILLRVWPLNHTLSRILVRSQRVELLSNLVVSHCRLAGA